MWWGRAMSRRDRDDDYALSRERAALMTKCRMAITACHGLTDDERERMTVGERLVALVFLQFRFRDHFEAEGEIQVRLGATKAGTLAGVTERTVGSAIRKLKRLGAIEVIEKGGRSKAPLLRFDNDWIDRGAQAWERLRLEAERKTRKPSSEFRERIRRYPPETRKPERLNSEENSTKTRKPSSDRTLSPEHHHKNSSTGPVGGSFSRVVREKCGVDELRDDAAQREYIKMLRAPCWNPKKVKHIEKVAAEHWRQLHEVAGYDSALILQALRFRLAEATKRHDASGARAALPHWHGLRDHIEKLRFRPGTETFSDIPRPPAESTSNGKVAGDHDEDTAEQEFTKLWTRLQPQPGHPRDGSAARARAIADYAFLAERIDEPLMVLRAWCDTHDVEPRRRDLVDLLANLKVRRINSDTGSRRSDDD